MEIQIQRLKKKLLREELRRRRKSSSKYRLLLHALLLGLILLFGGLIFYTTNLDRMLEEDYAEAEALVEKGSFAAATGAFRRIYDRHPSFRLAPQALFQSGEVLNLYLKRYPEALLAYLLVERDYPGTEICRKAQLQAAEIYKNRQRDFSQAIIAYQKLLDAGAPGGDRIQYELADCFFRLNNFEQARIEFEALLKSSPTSPLAAEVQYRIAVTWSLEGKLREAEGAFRQVIAGWPESPYAQEAAFGLAALLEEREELAAALGVLEGLQGRYDSPEILASRIEQVKKRLGKKKKAA